MVVPDGVVVRRHIILHCAEEERLGMTYVRFEILWYSSTSRY